MGKINKWKISAIILFILLILSLFLIVDSYSTEDYEEILNERNNAIEEKNDIIKFYAGYFIDYSDYTSKTMELENAIGRFTAYQDEIAGGGSIFTTDFEKSYEDYETLAPKVLNLINILEKRLEEAPEVLFNSDQKTIEAYKRSFEEHKELINQNLKTMKEELNTFKKNAETVY